ncbi:hypothetical protein [Chitinophaga sp. CF418]|uniref:hypothetical protein n=1 Tax=Chitinophaga sp. CF418 TaxID=1855287 RepID=UPI000922B3A3|nr:hypothetical protein [Chitinophaga sp. CF418]SHN45403.1 hypothetical protein SAMN05216311_12035 [Chitinophaga sp. CF418]
MFEIIINQSVGPFMLGQHIENYITNYHFEFTAKQSEHEDWDCYSYGEGVISIYTKQGIIESIACRTDCYLSNYFLIDADMDDFLSTFKIDKQALQKDTVFVYDDISQDVYEVDELGMQIWVDNDNKIVTVFVSPQDPE